MAAPFHRPFQYIGLPYSKVEKIVDRIANELGNIIVENNECKMLLEAEGGFVSYVDVEIKRTSPHYQDKEFDSEPILGSLSISFSEIELIRKAKHYHTYYDHRRRLKIGVSCQYDGAPLSVGISSKYYGQ